VPQASNAQTIERVFGRNVGDPVTQHAKTSLQRWVIEHMKRGRRWRNAAGLFFPEDIFPEDILPKEVEAEGAPPVDSHR
jgi:hypothetical protein